MSVFEKVQNAQHTHDNKQSIPEQGRDSVASQVDVHGTLQDESDQTRKTTLEHVEGLLHCKPLRNISLDRKRSHTPLLKEQPVHRAMAVCMAQGDSIKEIAAKFGYTPREISYIANADWFRDLVLQIQTAREYTVEQRLSALGHAAVTQLTELLTGAESENVRERVSNSILDRVLGRAVQRVESFSASLRDMQDLEEQKREAAALEEKIRETETEKQKLREQLKREREVTL